MRPRHLHHCWVIGLAILFMVASQLHGADQHAQEPTEKISFRSQDQPDPRSTGVTAIASRALLREYLKTHPNVDIQPFVMPVIGGSAMDSGPLMAIAAGIPPHVIYVNFRMSSTYLAQGFLQPTEILLARILSDNPKVRQIIDDKHWAADPTPEEVAHALELIRQRVPAPAWPVIYRQDESGRSDERHAWAVPTGTFVMGMQYRKDLFVAAGLDPERPPRNWDEFLEYARKLTIPSRNQYGLMMVGGQTLGWGAYTFLVSAGGRAVQRDENGNWYAAYGSRQAAIGVEFLWRLMRQPFERDGQKIPGAVYTGTAELEQLWKEGRIAMRFAYLTDEILSTINPQLVGLAAVPTGPSGQANGELNCSMLGVYSGSSLAQQLEAMRYIWFVTSEQAQRIRTATYVDFGYGQFVNPALLAKFGYDRILQTIPPAWRQAYQSGLAGGVPEPYGRNTQNIYRYLSDPMYLATEMDLSHLNYDQRVDRIEQVLKASAEQVNVRVLGNITPSEMRTRRIAGSAVMLLVAAIFIFGMVSVWRYFTRVSPVRVEDGRWRRYIYGYVLLAPGLLLTLGWAYLPLLGGAGISLSDYRIVLDSVWVGVDNYANALFDPRFWSSLGHTFYFVALSIGLGFWPPILLAILLDEVPTATLKYIFRTIFYLPAVIVGVVIMIMWKQFYDPSSSGMLNQVVLLLNDLPAPIAILIKLMLLGVWISLVYFLIMLPIRLSETTRRFRAVLALVALAFVALTIYPLITLGPTAVFSLFFGQFAIEPIRWIQSPQLAMLCTIIPLVWAGAGPGCLLYLAALKTVQGDLYEAADIDGANYWHKLFYITLPRMKYLISIQFIAAVVGAFKGGTDYILALTGGGPGDATNILDLEIFVRTFMELQFGSGAAMAWILGALLIAFTAYQLRMLSGAEFKTATRV
ncbi:MAG: extracellular solute-binding protein [Phycisphaerales bacterium]|nr:extracellular solute-binding protein [Phycisphaerales bacterium]